jgi:hypothetical protein
LVVISRKLMPKKRWLVKASQAEVVYGGPGLADGSRLIQGTWIDLSIRLQSLRAKSGVSVLNLE